MKDAVGARDVFEEGIWIPIVRLMIAGERNHDAWKFILSNVRQPDHMARSEHGLDGDVPQHGPRRLICFRWSGNLADPQHHPPRIHVAGTPLPQPLIMAVDPLHRGERALVGDARVAEGKEELHLLFGVEGHGVSLSSRAASGASQSCAVRSARMGVTAM